MASPQASDEASLHALEALMNEFFSESADNLRKREIGNNITCKFCLDHWFQISVASFSS